MSKSIAVNLPAVTEEKQTELRQQLSNMDRLKQAFMQAAQMQKPVGWVPTEQVVGPMFGAGVLKMLPKLAQYVTPEEVAAAPKAVSAFIDELGRILKIKGSMEHAKYLSKASTEFMKPGVPSNRRTSAAMAKEKAIRLLKYFDELNLEHYTEPTTAQRTTGSQIVQAMRKAGKEPNISYEMKKASDILTPGPNLQVDRVNWSDYLRKVDEVFGRVGAR